MAYDPYRPEVVYARLKPAGIPVWALVGSLPAVGQDPVRVAHDYHLPLEAVEAAPAYYERHRAGIDAKLEADAAYAAS